MNKYSIVKSLKEKNLRMWKNYENEKLIIIMKYVRNNVSKNNLLAISNYYTRLSNAIFSIYLEKDNNDQKKKE